MNKKVKKQEKKDLKPVEEKKEIIVKPEIKKRLKQFEKNIKKKKFTRKDIKILEGNAKADLANEKSLPEDHSFFKDLKRLLS